MKLRNPFSQETRELFYDTRYTCFLCGGNGQDCGGTELNHTVGRSSNSPYNGSVLCHSCHSHVGHTKQEHDKLIIKTVSYLTKRGYTPTENDILFLEEYAPSVLSTG